MRNDQAHRLERCTTVPLPLQAIQDDEVHIPSAIVLDAVAADLFATSGTTPGAAQTLIDRDLKPQSQPLPDTTLTLHFRNSAERTGVTNNVAALLPGSDPRLATETILITAHHDHDGTAPCADPAHPPVSTPPDPHPCPQIWHGADDNGSGTVGVVELARAFAANRARPKRSILSSSSPARSAVCLALTGWPPTHCVRSRPRARRSTSI